MTIGFLTKLIKKKYKKGKPQPAIYDPLMDMVRTTINKVPVRLKKFLPFDVMNVKINDCFEILAIIAHVSLDIN